MAMKINLSTDEYPLLISSIESRELYLITIIIPTFDRTEGLIKAINSTRSIHKKDLINLLVIDNGSDNKNDDIITNKLINTGIDYSYMRNNINLGLFGSLNVSCKIAKSIYVTWLFDDDNLNYQFNKAIELIEKEKYPVNFFFNKFKIDLRIKSGYKQKFSVVIRNYLNYMARRKMTLCHRSLLFTVPSFIGGIVKKEHFLAIGGFNLNIGSTADYEFTIRLWENFGITRIKYQTITFNHGFNESSKSETYSKFPISNLNYRLSLLERLDLTEKKRFSFKKRIFEIYRNESKLENKYLSRVLFLLNTIMNYLNFL